MSSIDLSFDECSYSFENMIRFKAFLRDNPEFHSKGYVDNGEIVSHIFDNKIYLSTYNHVKGVPGKKINLTTAINLVEKIENNADIFCTLEASLRKIPVEQVTNIDLKLLINNLKYQSLHENAHKDPITEIIMTAETPLACLGCIAQSNSSVTIVSTKETAAICTLFVNLCLEVGLENHVSLMLVSHPPSTDSIYQISISNIKEFTTGCLGVVSNKADFDSAVDNFLYASSQYPWIIKKILVQESAIDRFIKAIEWKTKKPSGDVEEHIIQSSTNVYVYDDKIYLYEFVGNIGNITNAVIIEAYRTNKELLQMISAFKPFCISLWSSDVSEANEIISSVDSTIVWVNDYGYFDGPPISSQGFYSLLQMRYFKKDIFKISFLPYVIHDTKSWLEIDIAKRFMIICDVLKNHDTLLREKFDFKMRSNSTTTSYGNKVFIAERISIEGLIVFIKKIEDILYYLDYIINGHVIKFVSSLSYVMDNDYGLLKLCKALKEATKGFAELPVDINCVQLQGLQVPCFPLLYKTKTIWTSNGTIFAN